MGRALLPTGETLSATHGPPGALSPQLLHVLAGKALTPGPFPRGLAFADRSHLLEVKKHPCSLATEPKDNEWLRGCNSPVPDLKDTTLRGASHVLELPRGSWTCFEFTHFPALPISSLPHHLLLRAHLQFFACFSQALLLENLTYNTTSKRPWPTPIHSPTLAQKCLGPRPTYMSFPK